jgi:hypothetical protein
MSLSVLKDGLRTMSHFIVLSKRTQQNYQYLFNLLHILTINKIKYDLYDGIVFQSGKSPNFVKLMLESWVFS